MKDWRNLDRKEYIGVYVEGLENADIRNKGDELIPKPNFELHTLIDDTGYFILWPIHM
jgi:hypothetical protein